MVTRALLMLVAAFGLTVLAGCSGGTSSDGNRAPRATASGLAPAAPHAEGPGRAGLGTARPTAKKSPSPWPEEDPFNPTPGPDAAAPTPGGPTHL
ncbi:MAG: hypothetical protein HY898_26910 [Deltaproteobacteria bacterium]|nr:hypothetical protein [Deltaproteobacteria bacterium]